MNEARTPFAVVTVAATIGSVPRAPGSKMFVHADGRISGTIGGGKFESLVIAEAQAAIQKKKPLLKTYPLREGESDSFGAICGGEVTVFIEPQITGESLYLIGAGHCAHAIAKLAAECGLFVSVVDDSNDLLDDLHTIVVGIPHPSSRGFIMSRQWQRDDALNEVSRNQEVECEAPDEAV